MNQKTRFNSQLAPKILHRCLGETSKVIIFFNINLRKTLRKSLIKVKVKLSFISISPLPSGIGDVDANLNTLPKGVQSNTSAGAWIRTANLWLKVLHATTVLHRPVNVLGVEIVSY